MTVNPRNPSIWLILALVAVVVVAVVKTRSLDHNRAWSLQPEGIMGTSCRISVVDDPARAEKAASILESVENQLRGDEAMFSSWIQSSEISRLNRAEVGETVPLSILTLDLLRRAQRAHVFTHGTFDITVGPLISLWREAGRTGVLPDPATVAGMRNSSSWDLILLRDADAVKRAAGARVDLGGIAKGYALDRALEQIRQGGAPAGMVDVGGDLCFYGKPPGAEEWKVEIVDPFSDGILMTLHLPSGAVCTSGNYARYSSIEGKNYSHILDPRTGFPVEGIPSITVVAPTALQADIWATALSVLGEEGLDLLPDGVQACMVQGTQEDHRLIATEGFATCVDGEIPGMEIR